MVQASRWGGVGGYGNPNLQASPETLAAFEGFDRAAMMMQQLFVLTALREIFKLLEAGGLFGAPGMAPLAADSFSAKSSAEAVPLAAPMFAQAAPAGTLRAGELQRADEQRLQRPRTTAATPATPASTGPATVVSAQRTPLTGTQARDAIREAWVGRYGEEPSEQTLAVLTAQWALETGRGASMMNYNFGGIKGTGPSGLTTEYGTREGYGATETRIRARFRAYNNAAEGAGDYLSLLDRRYPNALAAARTGDASGFVHELKRGGYFTGNEEAYTRSVRTMSQQALAQGFDSIGARTAVV